MFYVLRVFVYKHALPRTYNAEIHVFYMDKKIHVFYMDKKYI